MTAKAASALPHLVAYCLYRAGTNSYLGMLFGIAVTREENAQLD